jgi:hypothetical protein
MKRVKIRSIVRINNEEIDSLAEDDFFTRDDFVKKIRSCKIVTKLNKLTELNLKEEEPFITILKQDGMPYYNVHFTSCVNYDVFKSPIQYLIKKGVAKKEDIPFRIRKLESTLRTPSFLKTIRFDLRENQAIAYINFYLKNKNPK